MQIHRWLLAEKQNVVVLHCLAGKGRTGLVRVAPLSLSLSIFLSPHPGASAQAIATYLMYCGLFSTAEEALNYFAVKRSTTNWGVTGPSQRR